RESVQKQSSDRKQRRQWVFIEEQVLVEDGGGGHSENQRNGQSDEPVHAYPVHQLEKAQRQRQAQSQINQLESNLGMRGKQMQHRPQEEVESRRLLLQIENTSPEIVPQQRGVDILPIEVEGLGVEPDSRGEAQQPRRDERPGEERQTGSAGGHFSVYLW